MEAPDVVLNFYSFIMAIQGWILFPLLVLTSIVILIRGFSIWRNTGGDWQAVFKAIESLLVFFVIIIISYSVLNTYDWLRNTELGRNLPDLSAEADRANN
ncbi:MAG: hypothetical protein AAGF07_02850 [Patescibacteria group bacterium]